MSYPNGINFFEQPQFKGCTFFTNTDNVGGSGTAQQTSSNYPVSDTDDNSGAFGLTHEDELFIETQKSTIAQNNQEINRLTEENKDFSKKFNETQLNINQKCEELSKLENELNTDIPTQKRDIESNRSDALADIDSSYSDQLSELESLLEPDEEGNVPDGKTSEQIQSQINNLKQTIDTEKAKVNNNYDAQLKTVEEREEKLKQAEIPRLNQEIDGLSTDMETLGKLQDTNNAEIESLTQENSRLQADINNLLASVNNNTTALDFLKSNPEEPPVANTPTHYKTEEEYRQALHNGKIKQGDTYMNKDGVLMEVASYEGTVERYTVNENGERIIHAQPAEAPIYTSDGVATKDGVTAGGAGGVKKTVKNQNTDVNNDDQNKIYTNLQTPKPTELPEGFTGVASITLNGIMHTFNLPREKKEYEECRKQAYEAYGKEVEAIHNAYNNESNRMNAEQKQNTKRMNNEYNNERNSMNSEYKRLIENMNNRYGITGGSLGESFEQTKISMMSDFQNDLDAWKKR